MRLAGLRRLAVVVQGSSNGCSLPRRGLVSATAGRGSRSAAGTPDLQLGGVRHPDSSLGALPCCGALTSRLLSSTGPARPVPRAHRQDFDWSGEKNLEELQQLVRVSRLRTKLHKCLSVLLTDLTPRTQAGAEVPWNAEDARQLVGRKEPGSQRLLAMTLQSGGKPVDVVPLWVAIRQLQPGQTAWYLCAALASVSLCLQVSRGILQGLQGTAPADRRKSGGKADNGGGYRFWQGRGGAAAACR